MLSAIGKKEYPTVSVWFELKYILKSFYLWEMSLIMKKVIIQREIETFKIIKSTNIISITLHILYKSGQSKSYTCTVK